VLNAVTGVCGLAAMLWLYGVAWHQPMAESIAWTRTSIADALPSASSLVPGGFSGGGVSGITGVSGGIKGALPASAGAVTGGATSGVAATVPTGPIDPGLSAQFADRRAKISVLKIEGPRMLAAGNFRRAGELCRQWTNLDLGNADAWRCLGQAMQAQGYHQDAINAFRKAKQYDPADRTLDAAIDRSQQGIVADFISKYRR
jgi:hypothetical protein